MGCRFLPQGLSPTGDRTCIFYVSGMAGGFLSTRTTWEALGCTDDQIQWEKLRKLSSFPQISDLFLRRQDRIIYIFFLKKTRKNSETLCDKQLAVKSFHTAKVPAFLLGWGLSGQPQEGALI